MTSRISVKLAKNWQLVVVAVALFVGLDLSVVQPAAVAHAATTQLLQACGASTPDCGFVKDYINPFVKFLSAMVGVVAIISFITAGIQYSGAAGDAGKVQAAKTRIRNTVIGLVAYLLMVSAINFLVPGAAL